MANEAEVPRQFTLIDVALKIGPAACAFGGGFYCLAYVLLFLEHPSLGTAAQISFGLAFGLGGYVAGRGLKKATDFYVANESEKRRLSTSLTEETQIPALAREIQRQNDGTSKLTKE